MKFIDATSAVPKRKRKPKPTTLDQFEPFLKLKAMILQGKMKPHQQVGILFDQNDVETLGMKFPWRTAADRLRRLLKETGLESDYDVVKYETDTPGVWFLRVTYEPPIVASAKHEKVG